MPDPLPDPLNDEEVRVRAYHIWQREGCPEGRDAAHWEMAKEELGIEANQARTTRDDSRDNAPEPIDPTENLGEFPLLTDQGEGRQVPRRRRPR